MSVRHFFIGHGARAKVVQANGFGQLHAVNADVELALVIARKELQLGEVHDDEISRGRILGLRVGGQKDLKVHGGI